MSKGLVGAIEDLLGESLGLSASEAEALETLGPEAIPLIGINISGISAVERGLNNIQDDQMASLGEFKLSPIAPVRSEFNPTTQAAIDKLASKVRAAMPENREFTSMDPPPPRSREPVTDEFVNVDLGAPGLRQRHPNIGPEPLPSEEPTERTPLVRGGTGPQTGLTPAQKARLLAGTLAGATITGVGAAEASLPTPGAGPFPSPGGTPRGPRMPRPRPRRPGVIRSPEHELPPLPRGRHRRGPINKRTLGRGLTGVPFIIEKRIPSTLGRDYVQLARRANANARATANFYR